MTKTKYILYSRENLLLEENEKKDKRELAHISMGERNNELKKAVFKGSRLSIQKNDVQG